MALEVHYQTSGTAYAEIGTAVRWGTIGLTEAAELGEAAISSLTVDDPAGEYDFVGLRRLYVTETAAGSAAQTVWHGYVADQSISRGDGDPWGAARVWSLSLVDDNAALGYRVLTGTAANRPAESGSARLAWALSAGSSYIADEGLVAYPGTAVQMDATDYRGQYLTSVLGDLANASGYEYFAQYDDASENVQLFFDDAETSTAYATTLKISNVAADVDGTAVLAPDFGATLSRDPSRIAGGVYLPYTNGAIYGTAAATIAEFGWRDQVAPSSSVKTAAGATAVLTRLLATMDEQEQRVSCRVWLPKAQVNDIRAGHRIEAKFSHFPGWEDYLWCRVVRRTVENLDTATGLYQLALELVPQNMIYTGDAFRGFSIVTGENKLPVFENLGDSPPAGTYATPTVAPSIFTPLETAGGNYEGVRVNRAIKVRIQVSVHCVFVAGGDQPVTLKVYRNATAIGTNTVTSSGGLRYIAYDIDLDLHDVSLSKGDTVTVWGAGLDDIDVGWSNGFGAPNAYYFRIGRGTFLWNSGTVEWTGP